MSEHSPTQGQRLQTAHTTSLTKSSSESLQRALLDRLSMSEAVRVVGDLLALFPNGGQNIENPYIGGLAKILVGYPRKVASRAADPRNGVARDTKYMPAPADLIAWCEREAAPMHEEFARVQRVTQVVTEGPPDQATAERMRALAKAWLSGEDPKAKLLKGHSSEVEKLRAERSKELNRAEMERRRAETAAEWTSLGMEPPTIANIPISRELAAKCQQWAEERAVLEAEQRRDNITRSA